MWRRVRGDEAAEQLLEEFRGKASEVLGDGEVRLLTRNTFYLVMKRKPRDG